MPKTFVVNTGSDLVREFKPGIGTFEIAPGERLEVHDFKQKMKLPNGVETEYVHTVAKVVADSLVADRGKPDLKVEVEEDEKPKVKKEEVKKEEAAK